MNNVVNTKRFKYFIQTLSMLMKNLFEIYNADIEDTFTLLKQIALSNFPKGYRREPDIGHKETLIA